MPDEEVGTQEVAPLSVIMFCPVCCSNIDVEGADGETVSLECISCEAVFTVTLDAVKIAKHSMYG